ncbi:Rv0909 family putative TA system antitoxin [Amycolatopsis sp. NPDC004378]
MGIDFDDLKNVANGDNVDQAAEFAKSRFGDHADKIDEVADRAKSFLGNESRDEQPSGHRDGDSTADDDSGRPHGGDYGRHAAADSISSSEEEYETDTDRGYGG